MYDKVSKRIELFHHSCLHSLNRNLLGTYSVSPLVLEYRPNSRGDTAPVLRDPQASTPDPIHKHGIFSWTFTDENFAKNVVVEELKTDVENVYNYHQT